MVPVRLCKHCKHTTRECVYGVDDYIGKTVFGCDILEIDNYHMAYKMNDCKQFEDDPESYYCSDCIHIISGTWCGLDTLRCEFNNSPVDGWNCSDFEDIFNKGG